MCGGGKCKMAQGGEVEEEVKVLPDKGFGKIIQINKDEEKYAEGGKVHEDEAEDKEMMDSEMDSMAGEELMAAIDAKDPKRLMESVEAIILHCLSKE